MNRIYIAVQRDKMNYSNSHFADRMWGTKTVTSARHALLMHCLRISSPLNDVGAEAYFSAVPHP
jgi:hypothetical protein